MIQAVALRGVLALYYEGRTVEIDLSGLRLADVIEYVERKTGKRVVLIAGQLGR
jgi:hypothetical protein